jgi:hypothetical protein
MTDIFENVTGEDAEETPEAPSNVTVTDENGEAPAAADTKPKQKRVPAPEGYVTPVGFAHLLNEQRADALGNKTLPPQHVYGWLRTNKEFPQEPHPETGKPVINIERGLEWFDNLQSRKSSKAAAKAEKEAAKAAAPQDSEAADSE